MYLVQILKLPHIKTSMDLALTCTHLAQILSKLDKKQPGPVVLVPCDEPELCVAYSSLQGTAWVTHAIHEWVQHQHHELSLTCPVILAGLYTYKCVKSNCFNSNTLWFCNASHFYLIGKGGYVFGSVDLPVCLFDYLFVDISQNVMSELG